MKIGSKIKEKYNTIGIVFKCFFAAVKINPLYFAILMISILVLSIAPIASSYVFSKILDSITKAGIEDFNEILKLILIYGIFLFLTAASWEIFASFRWHLYRYDITKYYIKLVSEKMREIDLEFFESPKYAALKKDALDGYDWRITEVIHNTFGCISDIVRTLVVGASLFKVAPITSIWILISIFPSLIVDLKLRSGLWDVWSSDAETRQKYGQLLFINTSPQFFKEVKLLNINKYFSHKLTELVKLTFDKQKKIQYKRIIGVIISSAIPIAVGGYFISQIVKNVLLGNETVGMLSFYAYNLLNFKDAASSALFSFGYIVDQSRYAGKVFEFLNIKPKITSKPNAIKVIKSPPQIVFDNVWFKYPESKRYVLKNFNLKIESGQKIAIVGENGVGKTTIVKLILRLYDVNKGNILVNGVDVRDLNVTKWREMCGVLLQDYNTFHLPTLGENIGFGNLKKFIKETNKAKTNEDEKTSLIPSEIIEVSKHAKADSFIMKSSKGYNEILGKEFGGIDLSGGEYQRLALARTFFRDSGLVIMDEPTSSVDAKAESEIFKSIKNYLTGKTVIFVSHRFSTVRIADRIVVINNGMIIEDGSHKDLLKANGMYKEMFDLQAEGYK